jgi:hypothetical protein
MTTLAVETTTFPFISWNPQTGLHLLQRRPISGAPPYCVWLKADEDKSFALAIDLPVMEDGGVQAYRYARRMALELRPKLHICYLLS